MIKILAVDDDAGIRDLIRHALEKDNYIVETAGSVEEVCTDRMSGYQLILLDVMMPGTDGFEFCEMIRNKVDCPILFLTAKTEEGDVIKGLGLGGDDYITKPFGIGELRARVAAHLRRERREKINGAAVGDFFFHLQEKRTEYNGKELSLTKGEYEICEYLAMNHGQVFSKDRIYEHVFGYDAEGDSRVVVEHIKNIRAKCQRAGADPIETVWGIGYKWK